MENPARELAEIFDGWAHGGGKAAASARAEYARKRGVTESQITRHAMACIAEIDGRLAGLQERGIDVSPFVIGLQQWQQGLIAAITLSRNTATEASQTAIRADHLNLLRSLALVLDTSSMSLMPQPSAAAAVEGAIDEAEAFVRAADVRDDVRDYLLRLLDRIRSALREGRPSDLRSAINEYVGATVIMEQGVPAEQRAGWAKAREMVLYPMLAGAGGNILSSGVMLIAAMAGQS